MKYIDISIIISLFSLFCSVALVVVNIVFSKSNKDLDYSRSFLSFVKNPDYSRLIEEIRIDAEIYTKNGLMDNEETASDNCLNKDIDMLNSMLYELEVLLSLFRHSKKIKNLLDDVFFKKAYENDVFYALIMNKNNENKYCYCNIKKRLKRRRESYDKRHKQGNEYRDIEVLPHNYT